MYKVLAFASVIKLNFGVDHVHVMKLSWVGTNATQSGNILYGTIKLQLL